MTLGGVTQLIPLNGVMTWHSVVARLDAAVIFESGLLCFRVASQVRSAFIGASYSHTFHLPPLTPIQYDQTHLLPPPPSLHPPLRATCASVHRPDRARQLGQAV